jgi:hypothetical protein
MRRLWRAICWLLPSPTRSDAAHSPSQQSVMSKTYSLDEVAKHADEKSCVGDFGDRDRVCSSCLQSARRRRWRCICQCALCSCGSLNSSLASGCDSELARDRAGGDG